MIALDEVKDLNVNEISEGTLTNLRQRFSSPFFGALLIAWLWENHKGLGVFLFSDNKKRISIIEQYSLNSERWDLLVAFSFALLIFYFLVPMVQSSMEWGYFEFYGRKQINSQSSHEKEKNDLKVESELEYRRKLKLNQLDDWQEMKKGLESRIHDLELALKTETKNAKDEREAHASQMDNANKSFLYQNKELRFYSDTCADLFYVWLHIIQTIDIIDYTNTSNDYDYKERQSINEGAISKLKSEMQKYNYIENIKLLGLKVSHDSGITIPDDWHLESEKKSSKTNA